MSWWEVERNRSCDSLDHQIWDFGIQAFKKVPWWEVRVGSLVRVTTLDDGCSAMIPCDIALLASSNLDGSAFLETANLDGETNLKVHQPACLPHIHCLYVRLACVACLDNLDGDHSFETANLEAQTHLKVRQPPDPPAHALSVGQSVGLSLLVLSAVRHKKRSLFEDGQF